jgi:hypothetical protein
LRRKGSQRLHGGTGALGGGRVHQQHALAIALGQHHQAAVMQARQRGQRGQRQTFGHAARGLGLQAQALGGQQQVLRREGVMQRFAQAVQQGQGVGGHLMQPGYGGQGLQVGQGFGRRDGRLCMGAGRGGKTASARVSALSGMPSLGIEVQGWSWTFGDEGL